MTLTQIIEDLKSDRIKTVIIDSDTYNEMDDQYALAYSIGSSRMKIAAINAVLFHNDRSESYADGMEKSYEEIMRVLSVTHRDGLCPVFKGCTSPVSMSPDYAPVDSPASRNIIKLAKEADEMIYILAMGAITNVASAILIDPTIKEKICVIWLGGHCIERGGDLEEFNLMQDYRAGQIVLNSGVNLVLLPAYGPDDRGTQRLVASLADLQKIKGNSDASIFFRETLPAEFGGVKDLENPEAWRRIIWDIAAPAAISVPEAMEFSVITAPIFGDNKYYAFDSTRHKIIYMERLHPAEIFEDAFACISKL